jgi:hypothetical protein
MEGVAEAMGAGEREGVGIGDGIKDAGVWVGAGSEVGATAGEDTCSATGAPSGITSSWPTTIRSASVSRLTALISVAFRPYVRAMPPSVSAAFTTCTIQKREASGQSPGGGITNTCPAWTVMDSPIPFWSWIAAMGTPCVVAMPSKVSPGWMVYSTEPPPLDDGSAGSGLESGGGEGVGFSEYTGRRVAEGIEKGVAMAVAGTAAGGASSTIWTWQPVGTRSRSVTKTPAARV